MAFGAAHCSVSLCDNSLNPPIQSSITRVQLDRNRRSSYHFKFNRSMALPAVLNAKRTTQIGTLTKLVLFEDIARDGILKRDARAPNPVRFE